MHIPPGSRLLRILAYPDAGTDAVVPGGETDRFAVYVRAPAKGGLANDRVLALIAAHLSVSRSRLFMVAGHRTPRKTVLLRGGA